MLSFGKKSDFTFCCAGTLTYCIKINPVQNVRKLGQRQTNISSYHNKPVGKSTKTKPLSKVTPHIPHLISCRISKNVSGTPTPIKLPVSKFPYPVALINSF